MRPRVLRLLVLIGALAWPNLATAETSPAQIGLAVSDFSFLDTSGEPTDQAAVHERRLTDFMTALRRDLAADGRFRLVLAEDAGQSPEEMIASAKAAGATYLLVGGVHKLSTLVGLAQVDAIDLAADRSILSKRFTFRGDTDDAWRRAESFISRDVRAALAPIKLAIFNFEYEDFSAAATSDGATPQDLAALDEATSMVRGVFTKSGGYDLVDVGPADDAAVKTRDLRGCNGCDAAIAQKLGAQQSFVGVIRRISRTEYTVRFQIRDAKTGAVLADKFSGLRMGADYSWDRGARRLVLDQYLEKKQP